MCVGVGFRMFEVRVLVLTGTARRIEVRRKFRSLFGSVPVVIEADHASTGVAENRGP